MTHAGYPNDWPQSYADADLLTIIAREIAFSQYLQAECARYDFRYFDTSHQFMQTLDEVVAFALERGSVTRRCSLRVRDQASTAPTNTRIQPPHSSAMVGMRET